MAVRLKTHATRGSYEALGGKGGGFVNLGEVRARTKRGVKKAIKAAMFAAVRYWHATYAKLHFTKAAHFRYPEAAYGAKYASNKPHGFGVVGSEGQWRVVEFIGSRIGLKDKSARLWYTEKEARQYKQGYPQDPSPLVFSGRTRAGVLNPSAFKVRGTSKAVRGSFTAQGINWWGLSKRYAGMRGMSLGEGLVYANPQEIGALRTRIEGKWLERPFRQINAGKEVTAT